LIATNATHESLSSSTSSPQNGRDTFAFTRLSGEPSFDFEFAIVSGGLIMLEFFAAIFSGGSFRLALSGIKFHHQHPIYPIIAFC
jgi:hypothetical protein